MASGGVMNWANWAGQYLERDMHKVGRQQQHVEEKKKQSFLGFSRKSGHKKDRFDRADQLSERLESRDWHWHWNSHRPSGDDAKPVSKFFWRSYENCWSPKRVSYALVCAEGDDVPGLTRAVFAVGSEGSDLQREETAEEKNRGLEVLRLNPGSAQWQQVYGDDLTLRSSPEGRDEHTCCYYRAKIFMFGGHRGSKLFKEVECYDIATCSWSVLESFVDGCTHPAARYSHACTTHDNMMYIHGGRLDGDIQQRGYFSRPIFTAELLSFNMDTLTWREVTPTFRQPPSGGYGGSPIPKGYLHLLRDRHSIVYVDGRIILFGGRGPEVPLGCMISGQPEYCEGFFEYNFTANKWDKIEISGYSPKAREKVASVLCGRGILYYGGYTRSYQEQGCLSDLFMMDTDAYHITLLKPYGVGPGARMTQMCAVGSDVILLGGAIDIVNKEKIRSFQPSPDVKPLSDMFILHTVPNLQQFCAMTIVRNNIDYFELPPHLQKMVEGSSDGDGGL